MNRKAYKITLEYKDDTELESTISKEILQEIWSIADFRNCYTDDTCVDDIENPDRYWE